MLLDPKYLSGESSQLSAQHEELRGNMSKLCERDQCPENVNVFNVLEVSISDNIHYIATYSL